MKFFIHLSEAPPDAQLVSASLLLTVDPGCPGHPVTSSHFLGTSKDQNFEHQHSQQNLELIDYLARLGQVVYVCPGIPHSEHVTTRRIRDIRGSVGSTTASTAASI
jgi:hypothetical protein